MNRDLGSQVEWVWSPLLSEAGLVAAVVVGLLVLWVSWRGTAGVSAGKRRLLLGLRLVTIAVLAFVLSGPQKVTTEGRSVRDPFVVLIDSSRSMRVEDGSAGSRAATVGRWLENRLPELEQLDRDYELHFFLMDEELRRWGGQAPADGDGARFLSDTEPSSSAASAGGGLGSGEPTPAEGAGTDIGAALFGLRDALGGVRPAGVLLASDGADRAALGRADETGGPAAVEELLTGLGFPVSTWAVGSAAGLSDLAIPKAHAPPFGFVRRPLIVDVDVARSGLPEAPVVVELHVEGALVALEEATFDEEGKGQVRFQVRPDRIGYHTYRLVTKVPAGDVIPSNNELEFTVKVVRDRTRILQVTSRPSWDVKFLRRLLKTDPNIDLVSFFILRTSDYEGELARREPLSLIAFPYEDLFTRDLQGFDLVIFQNFWFGSFASFSDQQFLRNVASFVEGGGALLLVGGDLTAEADYGNSALGDVLPSRIPRASWDDDEFTATLTEPGRRHPVSRLQRGGAENEERWAELPPMAGLNDLGELGEDAVVLLTAGKDGRPLVSVRSVGKGRTMLFASDSSWRWAMGSGAEGAGSRDHAAFWRNSLRWLVKDAEQRQVQVITDRENYQLGESIAAQVRVLGADYAPKVGETVRGTVRIVASDQVVQEIEGVTDDAGQLALSLPAAQIGTHSILVEVESIADPFGQAEARVSVQDREGELENPRVRRELMAAIAAATGGVELEADSPDPTQAPRQDVAMLLAVDRQSRPMWDRAWLLFLLGLPLGMEWILRRRVGLR